MSNLLVPIEAYELDEVKLTLSILRITRTVSGKTKYTSIQKRIDDRFTCQTPQISSFLQPYR